MALGFALAVVAGVVGFVILGEVISSGAISASPRWAK